MDKNNKRKTNYYKSGGNNWNNSKKKYRNYLSPGMKGFFCTCNAREKDCIKESLNILNEYADKMYGSQEMQPPKAVTGEEAAGGDIEDQLQEELWRLKEAPRNSEKFVAVDTGVKSSVFIKTTLEDPVKLAYTILSEAGETKTQKARFLLRIIPVEVTCKANLEDIKSAADILFDKHFRCEPTTFAVVINKRYNNSILRDELIHALALLVTDKNQEHKANLKEAHKTVLLEIMKGICCFSVLEDYKKLKSYNLAELTKTETTEIVNSETSKAEETTQKDAGEENEYENNSEDDKEEMAPDKTDKDIEEKP